jgi:hypothetical protein
MKSLAPNRLPTGNKLLWPAAKGPASAKTNGKAATAGTLKEFVWDRSLQSFKTDLPKNLLPWVVMAWQF